MTSWKITFEKAQDSGLKVTHWQISLARKIIAKYGAERFEGKNLGQLVGELDGLGYSTFRIYQPIALIIREELR